VVGTSGLNDDDYGELDTVARSRERGVLAVGNFALTVVLLQKFAEMAQVTRCDCQAMSSAPKSSSACPIKG
jgi:dihydrodipicolinate reductase